MVELAGYRIIEQLHTGIKSFVYRGQNRLEPQDVVIKVLRSEFPKLAELVQFRNQFTITRVLNLPNIIQSYALVPYRNSYALIMEDFGGISLKVWLEQQREMGHPVMMIVPFLDIAIQLADVLHGLYQKHVIHKDIKPSNILINPETHQIKLTDFSIASLLPREANTIHTLGVLEGTLTHVSPEQTGRMNRGIDYRTDYYSLGITLYELLTGHLPFEAQTPIDMVYCHMARQPPPIQHWNPSVPGVVSEIVDKLMAKNPEDRYQSALGLKHDLERCRTQLEQTGAIVPFALGQRDISDRFLIPEKLYGRDNEVATLLSAFERIVQRREAGYSELILITGYSGIGKTAVINEVQKPIVRQQGYFIKGKFDQLNCNIPFSAFLAALRDLMGQLLIEPDLRLQQWRTRILQALGNSAQLIIDVVPELEQIIGPQSPVVELAGDTAQNRFNLLFQKFIQVFATVEHPLVMFLDDLQWADLASLELLGWLMKETACRHLLVIGAYRDNEVSPAHPLLLTLESIRKNEGIVHTLSLPLLSTASLNQLVADTLTCNLSLAQPLGTLIHQKTQGNPFFATQFLQALYQDGIITFDVIQGCWQCDIVRVREAALTEDVVAFMAQQIQKLPSQTQNILKLASCIGNQFDLTTLAIVSQQPDADVAQALWSALEMGLVLPQNEVYKFFLELEVELESPFSQLAAPDLTYQFLHDRIQQAAYSLIPQQQKQETHLTIGRLLLHNSSPSQREKYLFAIVNHLNRGQVLLQMPAEREELAQLNLQAGRKAQAATAYRAAADYLHQGIQLLPANAWEQQYDLTLALHQDITEATYLCTDFEQMEQWAAVVIHQARSLLDTVPIYEARLLAGRAQGNYLGAVRTGLEMLHTLGVDFPEQPTANEVQQTLTDTYQLWCDRPPLTLLTLPLMEDPQHLAAMQIMTKLTAPTYRALPTLMPLLMAKQVEFSIRFGNSPISIFSYAGYGMALCSMGNIDAGYSFGQLSLALLAQLQATACESRAGYLVHNFISHWKEPIHQSLPAFVKAYQSGLATGDLECVVLNAQAYCHYAYFSGLGLANLATEMAAYQQTLRQFKQVSLKCLEIVQQTVLNLLDEGETPWLLTGSVYNSEESVAFHLGHGDRTSLFHYHFNQTVLYYQFGYLEQAEQQAQQVEIYQDGGRAQFPIALYAFYDALIQLARYPQIPLAEKPARWERILEQEAKLKHWATFSPHNHRHRWELIEAEKARIEGRTVDAIEAYDRAIATAKADGFPQDESLANELAAKFYLAWGRDKLAQPYLQDAYYGYAGWGAKAKAKQLEILYPQRLQAFLPHPYPASSQGSLGHATDITSSSSDTAFLDLTAVIKASQAISKELDSSQLIITLIQLALHNAGAEQGALTLLQDNQLMVVAQCFRDKICTTQMMLLTASESLPTSLIHLVFRTIETFVIDDIRVDPRFAADPYIVRQAPRSVLCMPLMQKNQPVGVLYLENSLTSGAFTHERINVLKILCGQAAISLDNATLYENLQTSNRNLQKSLETLQKTQTRLLQATEKLQHDALYDALTNLPNRTCFMNLLNHAIQLSKRHPERLHAVLFIDLDRFKNINDSLGHLIGDEFLKLAGQRLQSCIRPSDVVARLGGDEFAILLENLHHLDDALEVAQRIQSQFALAFRCSDYEIFSTTSTGITYSTFNYQEATEVLRDADIALYQAKANGRNQYAVFNPTMQTKVARRLQLENELHRALAAQEFCLYYQPIISLSTGQLRGFEALIRWQHPTRGQLSPAEFIPVAEETGLIGRIGWWVLQEACQQMVKWLAFNTCSILPVLNVNLSALQLKQPELIEQLETILQATQIPRECLKLEITESCILETFTSEAQVLKRIKALGIRLCIDDFGTGYSSLSRLHEFPIDTLKIDRSFVQRLNQNSLETVQMILTLAHGLGMDVVAEGIETETELEILRRLGCEFGQGYWYAPPLDATQAFAWLAAVSDD
ncbi:MULTISPECIES: EAL domain-containing protein [unclassified Leptolyngbya]|uniref:EAL domain-containing protein n=1 Tax=unclassified Leptolyngbya TaxID=2650499 RepID=UPI00168715A2|nr:MULTISPECIES: EAL domain-containing protein [unclassified Leptolyngbya]MBD1913194.1 EAL domain-containing protein [Leptolyngbya sp. FACHB-8]MBD2154916.1 EAL domain-containing protein [Leptolyngbya sp. FACHB-16]